MELKRKIMIGLGIAAAVAGMYWWKSQEQSVNEKLAVGDRVLVIDGEFADFEGEVSAILENGMILVYNDKTSYEVSAQHVKKI